MTAEKDIDAWTRVADQLGIEIIAPFKTEISGSDAVFTTLFPEFGAPKGMVIDADWNVLEPHTKILSSSGYGYSCAGISGERSAEAVKEMFADWGWSSSEPAPTCLTANS